MGFLRYGVSSIVQIAEKCLDVRCGKKSNVAKSVFLLVASTPPSPSGGGAKNRPEPTLLAVDFSFVEKYQPQPEKRKPVASCAYLRHGGGIVGIWESPRAFRWTMAGGKEILESAVKDFQSEAKSWHSRVCLSF